MTRGTALTYREAGASWRPLWIVLALLATAVLLDVILPGPDHVLAWLAVIPLVAGVFALSAIDARHLQAMADGGDIGGVETGAQVLGGGWSVPKGRVGLPLRRTDGAFLLVPSRDPDSLRRALLARLGP